MASDDIAKVAKTIKDKSTKGEEDPALELSMLLDVDDPDRLVELIQKVVKAATSKD